MGRTWAESTSHTYTRFGAVTTSPRSGSDPNWLTVTRPSRHNPTTHGATCRDRDRDRAVPCRVERAEEEEEEERARLSLFSLSYQVMKHSTL